MKKLRTFFALLLLISVNSWSQDFDKKIVNWYNKDGVGMNTDNAYKKLLAEKKSTPVIVAVIDSGVDIEHEDLKGHIWINEDEIPGNGIDDDNNGYIDDVHGWNFLGNTKGENLVDVQLEMTRIYARLDSVYAGRGYEDLNDEEKTSFDLYKDVKESVEKAIKEATENKVSFEDGLEDYKKAHEELDSKCGGFCNFKQLKAYQKDPAYAEMADDLMRLMSYGFNFDEYMEAYEYWCHELDYNYNLTIYPRSLVGDDPANFKQIGYGNNNVLGLHAEHGTHVSGIIAAIRGNGLGGDGVADNALIMCLRAVPDGDEEDKDVALAVRYAVDNGAMVINMSFGKSYSPYQDEMIAAFAYAEEHGVLVVHAAGNEALNNDEGGNFPTAKYPAMSTKFNNWIEVGASTRYAEVKLKKGYIKQRGLVTDFSNYGKEMVDIFAPGHDILSTVPDNQYDVYDGTSMAGPMVAGVAALLKSYYPSLTMFEIKDIIFDSALQLQETTVVRPGERPKLVPLGDICVTGGVINVYNAVLLAEERSAKK